MPLKVLYSSKARTSIKIKGYETFKLVKRCETAITPPQSSSELNLHTLKWQIYLKPV